MKGRLLVLVALFWCFSLPAPAHASPGFDMDLTESPCCKTLSMPDTHGVRRQLSEFAGKVVIVTFGYTHCPDICPTTLSELAQSMKLLQEKSKDVQVLFVTLDPERDTRAILSGYVSAFYPSFIALRGSAEETMKTARDFRVLYKKVPDKKSKSYSFEHTAGVYLFDRSGKARLYARSTDPKTLLPEIKRLLTMRSP